MLSIIVSWRDRDELAQALPGMIAAAAAAGGDLTVVNYGGSRERLARQIAGCPGSLRIVEVPDQCYFNKSRAQNVGARHTAHPLLFFCDCDIILDPSTIARLAARLAERPGTFATLAGIRETTPNAREARNVVRFGYELRIRIASGRELRIVDYEEDAADGTRQAPGLLLVRRENFLRINGYNGRLHGWGWEDQDMIARLTLAAGLERILEGEALHLSHSDEARVAHYPMADRWESRDRMFRQALRYYDLGDFAGTFELDCSELPSAVYTGDDGAQFHSIRRSPIMSGWRSAPQ
jgi:hypothetical protein